MCSKETVYDVDVQKNTIKSLNTNLKKKYLMTNIN